MDRIGIGLIGCGGIARSAHLPALAALSERVELRATADIDAAAAKLAAAPWGAVHSTDYRTVLGRPDIAAVIVATPEYLHAEQVSAAAAAGKHVLCEKPLARTLAEARRVLKPGGRFLFCEHGRAPDEDVLRWQRRIEPFWKPIGGGCHLTRRPEAAIREAGFALDWREAFYLPGTPRPMGWTEWGEARA